MLTGKRKAYADLIAAGSSPLEAAISAGFEPSLARQTAAKLENDEEILTYVNSKKKKMAKSMTVAVPKTAEEEAKESADKFLIGATSFKDPKAFLKAQMNNPNLEDRLRFDAAKTLLPLYHGKIGEIGKKAQKDKAAEKVAQGKFSASSAPSLKAVK